MSTIRIKNLSMPEAFNLIDTYKINIENVDADNMLVTISIKADGVNVKAMPIVTVIELFMSDKQAGSYINVIKTSVLTNSYEKIEVL